MTWHLVVGPTMQRQSMDEVFKVQTSSNDNRHSKGRMKISRVVLESAFKRVRNGVFENVQKKKLRGVNHQIRPFQLFHNEGRFIFNGIYL